MEKKSSAAKVEINSENSIKMLEYFQSEFLYRHEHFWRLTKLFFTMSVVVCLVPYLSEAFGVKFDIGTLPRLLFPVVALAITLYSTFILHDEAKKMSYVNRKKYEIISEFPELYDYRRYEDTNNFKKYLSRHIVWGTFVVQFVIELAVTTALLIGA